MMVRLSVATARMLSLRTIARPDKQVFVTLYLFTRSRTAYWLHPLKANALSLFFLIWNTAGAFRMKQRNRFCLLECVCFLLISPTSRRVVSSLSRSEPFHLSTSFMWVTGTRKSFFKLILLRLRFNFRCVFPRVGILCLLNKKSIFR